jgi:hypothetical protein
MEQTVLLKWLTKESLARYAVETDHQYAKNEKLKRTCSGGSCVVAGANFGKCQGRQ